MVCTGKWERMDRVKDMKKFIILSVVIRKKKESKRTGSISRFALQNG